MFVASLLKLSYIHKYKVAELYSKQFIALAKLMCGLKYEVFGLEKIPKTPAVYIANHQSFWENVFMQLIVPIHSWVIKKELLNIPILGQGLKLVQAIAVDRSYNMSVKQILQEGRKKLAQGISMVVFPESTRLLPTEYKKYKPSAIKLAMDAKVPLVLIAHNSGLYWPKKFWIKKPGVIKVEVLTTIYPEEIQNMDVRQVTEKVEAIINIAKDALAKQKD